MASEYNDFGGNLDQHSYEACLANIDQADFFILLIGSRVGGWFDASSRISITQQEYRHAYERHRQGKLRLVTFVRKRGLATEGGTEGAHALSVDDIVGRVRAEDRRKSPEQRLAMQNSCLSS